MINTPKTETDHLYAIHMLTTAFQKEHFMFVLIHEPTIRCISYSNQSHNQPLGNFVQCIASNIYSLFFILYLQNQRITDSRFTMGICMSPPPMTGEDWANDYAANRPKQRAKSEKYEEKKIERKEDSISSYSPSGSGYTNL